MKIEYRKFQKADLSKIKEFTEVMPTYFEDWNSYAPVVLSDTNCVFYGAFQGEKIIGLGNLRRKNKNIAWIELIRVRPDNQLKGIGTELFRFGDEIAKKLKYKIVGFATEGGNIGSCKIGEKLGFKLLTEMIPFWVESSKPKILKIENPREPIPIDEALNLMYKIPDGPKDYIAIGWNFVPLEKSFFEKEPDMKFYAKNKTILLEYLERDEVTDEVSWIKAIVYGAEEDAEYLISEYVERTKEYGEFLGCITTTRLEHIPEKMKFIRSQSEGGRPNTIVMWEKKL
ncbi:MAG: GNAT family N-acetyltransferase [Candidatus Heimdallarchaeota archaeon]|nr:GNAT family N-acetyltransferase [Candidatus Heimdallarchaeota archaeon]MBY8993878.1 GNAT family N-acetyltransferase [Candidatus Heimdallarchaeota archaeon]